MGNFTLHEYEFNDLQALLQNIRFVESVGTIGDGSIELPVAELSGFLRTIMAPLERMVDAMKDRRAQEDEQPRIVGISPLDLWSLINLCAGDGQKFHRETAAKITAQLRSSAELNPDMKFVLNAWLEATRVYAATADEAAGASASQLDAMALRGRSFQAAATAKQG